MHNGGRERERTSPSEVVDQLIKGESVRYVVCGDIGSGKSWFVDQVAATARSNDVSVVEVVCVEFEADVPFLPLSLVLSQIGVTAGNHPVLDAVFGHGGDPPNALSLGATVADVLHDHSADGPVVVLIDDAHWSDSDSLRALMFAARRLDVASVGFIFTAIPGANERVDRCGLDRVQLVRWSDHHVIDQLVSAGFAPAAARAALPLTAGNALAVELLIETVDESQRMGLAPLPPAFALPMSVANRIGVDFNDLSEGERLTAAVAAALPDADEPLFKDVLVRCGAPVTATRSVLDLGVVTFDPVVKWSSPIVRSAALRSVDRAEITAIHRHVADAAHAAGSDDLALRHRAAGGIAVNDDLADQLERAGRDAIERGALLTASEAFRQAAVASSNAADKSRRLSEAANQAFSAGNSEQAVPYARAAVEAGEGEEWATATSLLGEALLWTEGWAVADRTLCDGARLVRDSHPTHAAAMLIHATIQSIVALDAPAAAERHARATIAAEQSGSELIQLPVPVVGATAELLAGGARTADHVLADAGDLAVAALSYQHPIGAALAELVGSAAIVREAVEYGIDLLRSANDAGRAAGSVGMSAITSFLLTDALWRTGHWTQAQVEIGHAINLARDSGFEFLAECGEGYRAWAIAATGRRDECVRLAELSLSRTEPLQLRFLSMWAHAAIGLAALTDEDYEAAGEAYSRVDALWQRGGVREPNVMWWQSEYIEALALSGQVAAARLALNRLEDDAELTGRPHAFAVAARCRALLATDPHERRHHFDDALARLRSCQAPFDVARCLLMRGLDRIQQGDAVGGTADLDEAKVLFDRLGAHPWSDRASARPEEAPATPPGLADVLTEAELRVAVVIAEGAKNKEAAEQLFVSTKTVEYHLSNIYRKLHIRSRVDLVRYVSERV